MASHARGVDMITYLARWLIHLRLIHLPVAALSLDPSSRPQPTRSRATPSIHYEPPLCFSLNHNPREWLLTAKTLPTLCSSTLAGHKAHYQSPPLVLCPAAAVSTWKSGGLGEGGYSRRCVKPPSTPAFRFPLSTLALSFFLSSSHIPQIPHCSHIPSFPHDACSPQSPMLPTAHTHTLAPHTDTPTPNTKTPLQLPSLIPSRVNTSYQRRSHPPSVTLPNPPLPTSLGGPARGYPVPSPSTTF